ncbi:MAG: peptidoglycan DD-metalloendopeptidase family protein [Halorhodospira sp.]
MKTRLTDLDLKQRQRRSYRRSPSRRRLYLGAAAATGVGTITLLAWLGAGPVHEPEPEAPGTETADEVSPLALPDRASAAISALPEAPGQGLERDESVPEDSDEHAAAAEDDAASEDSRERNELQVRAGDNLTRLFRRAGHSASDVVRVLDAGEPAEALTRLRPGDTVTLLHDEQGELAGIYYPRDAERALHIEREDGAFQAEWAPRNLERELERVTGSVEGSLYRSARSAGLSDRIIMQLARVLDGDIDLGKDLRADDEFSVVYEKTRGPEGETLRTRLQAVHLDATGKTLQALRFEDPEGDSSFYTPDGTSLERTLDRYPVDFKRISSSFDRNRRHPVLGVRRPHLGVDLAAPRGTPVRAAGDGKIVERSRNGGYGRMITVRHGDRYRTRYAHLSRYASGLRIGDHVERGKVIGYVGNTGMSTGPHLHYELIVDGRHRNPVTAELPRAKPLPEEHRTAFEEHAEHLLAALDGELEDLRLAARAKTAQDEE